MLVSVFCIEFCYSVRLAILVFVFFFKQKTAYEMRISDWSSDVCSSDLDARMRRLPTMPTGPRTGTPTTTAAATGAVRPGLSTCARPRAGGQSGPSQNAFMEPRTDTATTSADATTARPHGHVRVWIVIADERRGR